MNILFVCTGNICRSPMAEGFLKMEVRLAHKQAEISVKSCGTAACDGLAPSVSAIIAARELGADISMQQSRSCDESLLEWADIIFCMAHRHVDWLIHLWPKHSQKVRLLDPDYGEVDDPIGCDCDFYRKTADRILELIRIRMEML